MASAGIVGSMPIPAILHDPDGPFWARAWSGLFPREPRRTSIELRPGKVTFRGRGIRSSVQSNDIRGASVAGSGGKYFLTLSVGNMPRMPATLELDSENDLKRVRDALAIGHDGVGAVIWPTGIQRHALESRLAMSAFCLFGVVGVLIKGLDNDGVERMLLLALGALAALIWGWLLSKVTDTERNYIAMRGDGVHTYLNGRPHLSRFAEIYDVQKLLSSLPALDKKRNAAVRALLELQIKGAVARAQGHFEAKAESNASDSLRRMQGELAEAWLARVDLLALSITGAGYHGARHPHDLRRSRRRSRAATRRGACARTHREKLRRARTARRDRGSCAQQAPSRTIADHARRRSA